MYTIKTNMNIFYNSELESFKDITSLLSHLSGNVKHIYNKNGSFIEIYKDGLLQEQYTVEKIIGDLNTLTSFNKIYLDRGILLNSKKITNNLNHYDYCLMYAEQSRIDKNFYKPVVVKSVFDNTTLKKSTSLVFPLLFVKDKKTLSKIKLIQNIQPCLEIDLDNYRLKIIE